jgi:ubiquinone/menaquinone biosynthesis C-methylase UbiE
MINLDKKEISNRYGGQAAIYDKSRFGSYGGRYMHRVELDAMLQCLRKGSILELGVGTGRCALSLVEKGFAYVGIDIAFDMLQIAKKNMKERGLNFDIINMDAERLGFADRFDNVICFHTFHFLPHPMTTLRNAFDVLKPGGRCIVSFGNRHLWNIMFNKFDVIVKNLYTSNRVSAMFKKVGFKVTEQRTLFNAPYRAYRKAPAYIVKQIAKIDSKNNGWLIGIIAGKKPEK